MFVLEDVVKNSRFASLKIHVSLDLTATRSKGERLLADVLEITVQCLFKSSLHSRSCFFSKSVSFVFTCRNIQVYSDGECGVSAKSDNHTNEALLLIAFLGHFGL